MKAAEIVERLNKRFPNEPEYMQAVSQVLGTIEEEYNRHPEFEKANLIERLCIPDRIISFRVTWVDDAGNVQTNMGYRIQHNNAIGPYKGGIRFHSSVQTRTKAQKMIGKTDFPATQQEKRHAAFRRDAVKPCAGKSVGENTTSQHLCLLRRRPAAVSGGARQKHKSHERVHPDYHKTVEKLRMN